MIDWIIALTAVCAVGALLGLVVWSAWAMIIGFIAFLNNLADTEVDDE